MSSEPIIGLLEKAVRAREYLFDSTHHSAFRLFNGFLEGAPSLVIDLYGATVLLQNYATLPEQGQEALISASRFLQERFPWIQTYVQKSRNAIAQEERHGRIILGRTADRRVKEHGVWYTIDLTLSRDAGLYLDTRILRAWAIQNLKDKSVLNTFAYTGSLGVAAMAAGARQVVHLDLSRRFLNLAKTSYTLNGFPIHRPDFRTGDFWQVVNRMKRAGERFDCVIIDPPFFAATARGVVDLEANYAKVINKVRPLIEDNGILVAINNALFVSGSEYMNVLDALCGDGYVKVEELIPVPADFIGYPETIVSTPITDPAPFNHATKIAVLRVRRKAR